MGGSISRSTVVGMISGLLIVMASIWATARDAMVFINLPGLLIVLGGTIAATLMSFPPRYLLRVWKNFLAALRNEETYDKDDIDEIVRISQLWRKSQIGRIEDELRNVESPFLRTGIQLILDGSPIEDIMELLEWRIERLRVKEMSEANVFRTMGSYAPAFGMVGTLLGLVNMLYDMTGENFDAIGLNMAVALITTFYGILFANCLFKPIAAKLEDRTTQRVRTLTMVLEAINMLNQKRSPTYIRETLYSFLAEYEDEVGRATSDRKAQEQAKQASS